MGRKTFESIGRPLPKRYNIVVTRQEIVSPHHAVEIANSINQALEIAKQHDTDKIYIIGGAEIYRQTIHLAGTLELTCIYDEFKADTYFPEFADFGVVVNSEEHEEGGVKFDFITVKKRK
jgi:dihydrofolate reductase